VIAAVKVSINSAPIGPWCDRTAPNWALTDEYRGQCTTAESANTAGGKPMMEMQCLDDASYVLGALTPTERREFQRHLVHCSRCRASVRQLTRVQWLLTPPAPPAVPDPGRS
jgi:hypothetical protein